MLKSRIIPILTFNGFALVKSKQFKDHRMVGNPIQAAKIYNSRGVDELIFLDIMASKENRKINLKIVKDVIDQCFMPIGIGGGIKTIDDITNLLRIGADKVILKSIAIKNPEFINESALFFGSQCISVSVDVIKVDDKYWIYDEEKTNIEATEFVKLIEIYGAGEIILNFVNNDGMMNGFDVELYDLISIYTRLPIVFVGGAGNTRHFEQLMFNTKCNAVGASSIFHFTQFTPLDIKLALKQRRLDIRLN
jgi:cyclase